MGQDLTAMCVLSHNIFLCERKKIAMDEADTSPPACEVPETKAPASKAKAHSSSCKECAARKKKAADAKAKREQRKKEAAEQTQDVKKRNALQGFAKQIKSAVTKLQSVCPDHDVLRGAEDFMQTMQKTLASD